MATDRLVKVTSDKGEETIERVPEGTLDDLRKSGVDVEDPKTGQKNTGRPVWESMQPGEGRNVAMDLAKCLRDALREHGDEMKAMYLANSTNEGVTIKVQYMPNEQGQASEDEFVFRWPDGMVRLDNVAHPVELGQLQKQSGNVILQKDLAKANLLSFLKSHDAANASDVADDNQVDPNALPDGPVAEEQLWESEECQNAFCQAVDLYRQAKDKESIKGLFRAARPFQKGNTIQEKLKGAVEWYNIYKEKPPRNTKDQVFLEDEDGDENEEEYQVSLYGDVLNPLRLAMTRFKDYINQSEDVHMGAYYRDLAESYKRLVEFCTRQEFPFAKLLRVPGITEVMDLDDPIAQGASTNDPLNAPEDDPYWNDEEDGPVMGEGDEIGPEVGDDVDYNGGNYKFYGYCGYQVVLQNKDDERDFKVVEPQDVGIGQRKADLEETNWVDPDKLPDDEVQRV